jgi:hypothetical protein
MKTTIKSWLLKTVSVMVAIAMASFGLIASILIFTESIAIVATLDIARDTSIIVLSGIGLALIWLITLLAESANYIVITSFNKANKTKGPK